MPAIIRTFRRHRSQRRSCLAVALACLTLFSGCNGVRRDVSHSAPYAARVGETYRVTGGVEGLAIRPFGANDPAYILLLRAPNTYTGTEVKFRRPVAVGAEFKIIAAEVNDTILDDTYYYVVQFNSPLDPHLPVHLPLDGDLTAGEGKLNPQYFQLVH